MQRTPKSNRLHIAILGRRNAGKSSLLNALTRQQVSIVSAVAGTTTDPVEKPMELLPIGPVLFVDTAGIDDSGEVGDLRAEKTRRVFDRTDIAVVVVPAGQWGPFEESLLEQFGERSTPVIVVFNKCDLGEVDPGVADRLASKKIGVARTVASRGEGILGLREALIGATPAEHLAPPALVADLVPEGELAVLVVPIDLEAPKGRLILPQVQTMRDLLDGDAYCLVVKERHLSLVLSRLHRPPALVVTDSQAFAQVALEVSPEIPLTSFSILFARAKGDLAELVRGAKTLASLTPGDPVLICESCSHHPIGDDIGREKIPAWLREHVGGNLEISHRQGHDFPDDLSRYKLVIHCGGCMHNRKQMLTRIDQCRRANVPITNYGLAIAQMHGILDRALEPFGVEDVK